MGKEVKREGIKVYTIKEGYDALKSNNEEVVKDIMAKYPQTCLCLVSLTNAPGFERFMEGLPQYVTLRKMEDRYRGKFSDKDQDDELEEEESVTDEAADEEIGMNPPEDEEPEEDADNPAIDYSTMTAVELYKLCKSRGLDVAQRQKTTVYIKQLEKLDAEEIAEAKTAKEAAIEEEEWGEDEEPEEAPAKAAPKKGKTTAKKEAKTAAKAPAKKSTKKAPATKAEEDSDEDWEW